MVKLTQVVDETATTFDEKPTAAPTAGVYTDESESESDSDIDDDFDFENETLYDRVVALKDIIPPSQRTQIANTTQLVKEYLTSGVTVSGNLLWAITSSALLLTVPLSLAVLAETQLEEMEKEMTLQQSAQDVLAPGSENAFAEKKA